MSTIEGLEFFNEEGLFSKVKSLVSSLYGIIFWTSRLPSPMQIPKEWPTHSGLKTVINLQGEPPQNPSHPCLIIHSYMIPSSSPPQSPSPSSSSPHSISFSSCSSVLDDLIGTESGVNYINSREEEITAMEKPEPCDLNQGKRNIQGCVRRKKYPPPIPLLARTGNLPGHMPWILTRHYANGKLIIKVEKVKHHEYFEAYRENSRLILNLVSLDNKVRCCHSAQKKEEELELQNLEFIDEEEKETLGNTENEEEGEVDIEAYVERSTEHDKSVTVLASCVPKSYVENGSERYGDLRKCFTYGGRMISDFNLYCNVNAHWNAGAYMAQSAGSAPLAFTARPLTTVV